MEPITILLLLSMISQNHGSSQQIAIIDHSSGLQILPDQSTPQKDTRTGLQKAYDSLKTNLKKITTKQATQPKAPQAKAQDKSTQQPSKPTGIQNAIQKIQQNLQKITEKRQQQQSPKISPPSPKK